VIEDETHRRQQGLRDGSGERGRPGQDEVPITFSTRRKRIADMVTSVSTLTDKVTNQGLPVAKNVDARQIPDWDSILIHEGSMKKQGGLGNSWMHRLFHLYRTSQGSFLCYYDNDGQTPPFSKDVKARNIIDISKVTQIRARSMIPNAPEHAFDLVTVERDFTFAPETGDIAAYWLKLLARATEEDVAVVTDEEFAFKLKVLQDSIAVFDGSIVGQEVHLLVTQGGLRFYASSAYVHPPIVTFKYTELYKWSAQVIQEYLREHLSNILSSANYWVYFVFASGNNTDSDHST
jgi:hypothetical protein